jgi:AraC-like DNA-binding protein
MVGKLWAGGGVTLEETRHACARSGWHNLPVQPQTSSTYGILEPDAGRARFELVRHAPADDIGEFVERHWTVSWSLPRGMHFTQELLPQPCANLVTESHLVAVHGIPLGRGRKRLEGSGRATGTKFRPGALAAFTGRAAAALAAGPLRLETVFGETGVVLEEQLRAAVGDTDRHIEAVERFLRAHRPRPDPRYAFLRAVVADMLVADRSLSVADFARRHAVSLRTLQRLFREYIGVTPKWVLKRYRVHEAAERLASGEATDAAWLAADLGYADQSHFIRDFASQVGCSPGAYARACALARDDVHPGAAHHRAA